MNAAESFRAGADRVLQMLDEADAAGAQRRDAQIAAALKLEDEIDRCMAGLAAISAEARAKRSRPI